MWQCVAILLVCGLQQALATNPANQPAHFYPFGAGEGDTVLPANDDGGSGLVSISTSFNFFGNPHSSLYVNNNGLISFLGPISSFTPDSFPLADGRRLIAPFWADVDTRFGVPGRVSYRETNDSAILSRAAQDISAGCVPNFTPTWVFIATWCDVTYFAANVNNAINSFQAVLVTDGTTTFTMFNYGPIIWTTGEASGGTGGFGGTPAQVGFNAGDGVTFFSVPGSQTAAIANIETQTNVNFPGRFIFQTDQIAITDCEPPPQDGDVRLVDENEDETEFAGAAQMFLDGEWGYVCDAAGLHKGGWPTVFCRQLLGNDYEATKAKKASKEGIDVPKGSLITKSNPACFPSQYDKLIDCPLNPDNPVEPCPRAHKKVIYVECTDTSSNP